MAAGALERVLGVASAWAQDAATKPAVAAADEATGVSPELVRQLAEKLAAKPFTKPKRDVPESFRKLGYDQYRDIRFRAERAVWHAEKLDYELQLFPLGWLYDIPVDIWIVEGGKGRLLKPETSQFTFGPSLGQVPEGAPFGFSGFRIHGPLNRADYYDEFALFQGASYFRAVGRNEIYGLSARGLAINTARPGGEEFPLFRTFWIEKPGAGAPEIVVHALLDSPSMTGAYRFVIRPGATTVMDVAATLFARKAVPYAGFAPLTSMFLHGPAARRVTGDFRPAVHDSEGLAILNGRGERLWRPLTNPKRLQISSFIDSGPKGFGLAQRDRAFRNFEDLEARYERRPTLWVEPKQDWGPGAVDLVEIPVEEEIHDNIVAFWRPKNPIEPGKPLTLEYRLHWGPNVPAAWSGLHVAKTRVGVPNNNRKSGHALFVVDFEGPGAKDLTAIPGAELTASAGGLLNKVVQRNPAIEGFRVTFELDPGSAELVELRLQLKNGEQNVSESWLYRWTRS